VKALRHQFQELELNTVAGSGKDLLHTEVLARPESRLDKVLTHLQSKLRGEKPWMNTWRAKLSTRIENAGTCRAVPHICVCIVGGHACHLEQQAFLKDGWVTTKYASTHNLYLKLCTNAKDLRRFLTSNDPLEECSKIDPPVRPINPPVE